MTQPRTIIDKIWDNHIVSQEPGSPAVLYIDLHLVHEVTSPQAFQGLRDRGLTVRRPSQTIATMDHSIPTTPPDVPIQDRIAARQIATMEANASDFGIQLFGMNSPNRGIVHVIGPELGLTQPGMTIVCGDSHTATHGAFGALAFGIGTSEVEHVLATQCLLQDKPKTYEVRVEGQLGAGVSAKDIILALLAKIGFGGGTGHVFEYTGQAVRGLSMEQRMTICNMSIEGGARAGLVAPDDTTFAYLEGREHVPNGRAWEQTIAGWQQLATDDGAQYDKTVTIDASQLEPMITYGTNPGMGMSITQTVPDPDQLSDVSQRRTMVKALEYMDLQPGQQLLGHPLDVVFIGSCTNSRISDLRQAAEILRDRKVAEDVRVMVVPGSQMVKKQAEAEGLDRIFKDAGAEWREAGCSMCIAMNGDQLQPGQYAISTSNRNFEGRQGKGGRTFLASPQTAAASAVSGVVTDARTRQVKELNHFDVLTGKMVAAPTENIDTDQIIPARFLKTISKTGLGQHLFADWRYEDGDVREDCVFNLPHASEATVLVAGDNFGCGSSREHAPWALMDFGFRAIVSTSFADIFRNNALKNGLLPVIVDEETHQQLLSLAEEDHKAAVTIDLAEQTLTLPDGRYVDFPIDDFSKTCLLEGIDQLGYLQKQEEKILAYEQTHPARINTAEEN